MEQRGSSTKSGGNTEQEERGFTASHEGSTTKSQKSSSGVESFSSSVQEVTETAKASLQEEAERAKEVAKETLQSYQHGLQNRLQETGTEIRQVGEKLTGNARQELSTFVTRQKGRLADEVNDYARRLQTAGDELRQSHHESTAELCHILGRRLADLGEYVRNSDPAEMRKEVVSLIREHPRITLAVVGTAALMITGAFRPDRKIREKIGAMSSSSRRHNGHYTAAGAEV